MDDDKSQVALKPFNTANRRFAVGQFVSDDEIVAGDRDPDLLRAARFIGKAESKAAEKAATAAKEADGLILSDSPDPIPQPDEDAPAPVSALPPAPEIKSPSRRK